MQQDLHEPAPEPEPRGLYGQRPSKSHDAARKAEFARIARMSVRERIIAALDLADDLEPFTAARPGASGPDGVRS